ncbi:hypothetical protein KIU17_001337 [Escherichia coli]|nr:hypothetical protein [Escherichia coli]EFU0742971.1 hypothetical protein [Escherichia coli]EGL8682559.1 hypothetical protein [Escherichia coli]EHN3589624.1 hypothetical protein [Escherichia coli]EIP9484600.1 hypothetical protein [Escherichia coli]
MEKVSIRKINRTEHFPSLNLPSDTSWVVWWYGFLKKNKRRGEQPKVAITFREVQADGTLCDRYYEQECLLTDLSFFKIGSVWTRGRCVAEILMEEKIFNVDFSYANGGWKINSLYQAYKEGVSLPYDFSDYQLKSPYDKNWLLEFLTDDADKVIIHPLEFFYRCYGHSDELKRVILTYSGNELRNRIFSEAYVEGDKIFYVKLRKRMNKYDAPFASFFALDGFTRKVIDRIQRQLDVCEDRKIYLKVAPWFKGKARIKVKGFWLENNVTFLGLSVTGVSLPAGYTINYDRDNTNLVDEKAEQGSRQAWSNVPVRHIKNPDEPFSVDNAFSPDSGASTLEVEASVFEFLDDGCELSPLRRKKAKYISVTKNESDLHSLYSVNEVVDEQNSISTGYMSLADKNEPERLYMESKGIVRDMWNAMVYLREAYSERIKSLDWYTPESSFLNTQEPELVAIPEFNESEVENDKISRSILNWPYLDVVNKKDIRGFLISRMLIDDNVIYFMEIQRRVCNEETMNSFSEVEKFKGLVFTLDNECEIDKWVSLLAHESRFVKGILQKIVGKCPGTAMTYKHSPAKNEPVACYSALLNALSKVGVTF